MRLACTMPDDELALFRQASPIHFPFDNPKYRWDYIAEEKVIVLIDLETGQPVDTDDL